MTNVDHADDLTAAMAELRERAERHGEPSLQGGVLFFGSTAIPKPDFEIVTSVHTSHGCTATIFVATDDGFSRATTTIVRDGERAVGTELDPAGPVIGPIRAGESYRGPADILGVVHDTYYEPIIDSDGAVIGAFLVGFPHSD
jgi:hypothetical protein